MFTRSLPLCSLWSLLGNGIREMYLFPALFLLAALLSICKGQHENSCDVVPKDPVIEVGSDINITCHTPCFHGKVYWKLDNKRLSDSQSKTVNSSHTVLLLRNVTNPEVIVECYRVDLSQVIGGSKIKTFSKPRNVSCFFHRTNQLREGIPDRFTCQWEHEINPLLGVNYSVDYSTSSNQSDKPDLCKSANEMKCTASEILSISLLKNMTIIVRAKTAAWEAVSDPHEFRPGDIVKMIPPKLNVTAFPDHLLVEWKLVSRCRDETCPCQVKYSKVVSEETPEWMYNGTDHKNLTITKVDSCTNYTVLVRCALGRAPWSDWSEKKTVLTPVNKHDIKLHLWRNIAKPEESGVRKVHIMWTNIPSSCQGNVTYTLYGQHMMGENYTVYSSPFDVNVTRDALKIQLTASTNEALEDSVYIPSTTENLPQVTGIQTSTLKGVIMVSWKPPIKPVSGYMIDWTHDGKEYFWKESKSTNTTLSDLLDKKPYDITVTPLFDDKTGHGTQALKICSRVGDPGNFTIDVQANDKNALVSWTMKPEGACSGAVVNYTILYGPQDGTGPQLNVTVDSTERFISLKGLNPDTSYTISVMATALTGTTMSSEMLIRTKRFDPALITALSIFGSIFILLVLSLGLYCAVQWKKFKEKQVPNPGHSSLVLWSVPNHQQPFSNPSESVCDRVYTEETSSMSSSTPPIVVHQASDQTEEYVGPDKLLAPLVQSEDLEEPGEPHLAHDDSTALLPSENVPTSPYRSQAADIPGLRPIKHSKHVPVKQPEKTTTGMVYVSLDMLKQGQSR